jgi:hypothetical protein
MLAFVVRSVAVDSTLRRHTGCVRERSPWADYRSRMATIVLRVRLVGGEHTDLTYEDPELVDEGEMVDRVVEALRDETGALRCRHGDRLVVLYARGVASVEVAPRGAVV